MQLCARIVRFPIKLHKISIVFHVKVLKLCVSPVFVTLIRVGVAVQGPLVYRIIKPKLMMLRPFYVCHHNIFCLCTILFLIVFNLPKFSSVLQYSAKLPRSRVTSMTFYLKLGRCESKKVSNLATWWTLTKL